MAVVPTNIINDKICELHNVLRRPMQFCRVLGLFPVEGLDSKNFSSLRFNLKSLYSIYYCITIVGQIAASYLVIYYFFTNDISLETIKSLIFFLTGAIAVIIFAKLAKKWPQLMKKASYLESRVAKVNKKTRRYDIIIYAVLLFGLCEHMLSVLFQCKSIETCFHKNNVDLEFIRLFFRKIFVFQVTSYATWKAAFYEFISFQSTFTWNFTDAITMCVSLYLTSYFNALNKLIEDQQKQDSVNWKEIRLYYSYCVELVHTIDNSLCYLILMSSFTNLFFICVQLFYLTNYEYPDLPDCAADDVKSLYSSIEHFLYYAFSFVFLFARASIASLLAANINTVAGRPLLVLQNVSTSEYTIEVQRFIRQIRYTTTALSGVCFYITRGMILTVIATVIKYELVILQFCAI